MGRQDKTETGWGSSRPLGMQKEVARYEFGLFKDDKLTDVFRTDVAEVVGDLEGVALKCAEQMRAQDPQSTYIAKRIFDRKPLPVVYAT